MDRVPDYESVGRRFEFCRARQSIERVMLYSNVSNMLEFIVIIRHPAAIEFCCHYEISE